jgi:hypothetical protein
MFLEVKKHFHRHRTTGKGNKKFYSKIWKMSLFWNLNNQKTLIINNLNKGTVIALSLSNKRDGNK